LAFYSATCALVVWLGSHGGNRPAQDFADVWAPGLNLTSPNSWHASLLQALSSSHALLLQDHGCVECTSESDRVPAPLTVSIALLFVQPNVGSRNSPPPLSTVTLAQLCMLFQSTHEVRGEVSLSRAVNPSTARRRMILSFRFLLIEHSFPYNSSPYLVTSH